MISDIAQEIVGVISFVAYLNIFPKQQKSIVWVEIIDTICLFLFLVADLMIAKKMKWFDGFWKGKISLVDMICAFLQDTELNSNPLLCNFFGLKYLLLRQRYYSVCGNEELGCRLVGVEDCSSIVDGKHFAHYRMGATSDLFCPYGRILSGCLGNRWYYLGRP